MRKWLLSVHSRNFIKVNLANLVDLSALNLNNVAAVKKALHESTVLKNASSRNVVFWVRKAVSDRAVPTRALHKVAEL